MTRIQHALHRARHVLWTAAILLFCGGAVAVVWLLVDRDQMAVDLEHEANLRGAAVSTLAGDVRALRAQVEAEGATPVAPDPTAAVEDLPERAEVPVPIPGPRGAVGPQGKPGEPGASGAPGEAGVDGSQGSVGSTGATGPQGEQGPAGAPGPGGKDGTSGRDGENGQTCPDGYSLQTPLWDADALVCRRDVVPTPDEPGKGSPAAVALDPLRRQYV